MSFPLYLLGCWGVTQIICMGRIFRRPRAWMAARKRFRFPLNCPMCVGFWVGVVFRLVIALAYPKLPHWYQVAIWVVLDGAAASAVSYFGCMLVNDDGLRLAHKNPRRANKNH